LKDLSAPADRGNLKVLSASKWEEMYTLGKLRHQKKVLLTSE